MEVTGSVTQTIRVQSAACQQIEHDAFAEQLRLQLLSQNRQSMQIHKLVLGSKFGAYIVEQSNDQGVKLYLCPQGRVVHARRRVVQYWWTKLKL